MTDKPILLIIDDQPDNLFVLTRVVESLVPGCEVVTAPSAEKGLALASEKNLGAALIDVQMPGMDGIEMCRLLKANPQNQQLPVILITSHGASAGLKAQGLEAGADDFISRPIDNEELAARIKVTLRVKRAEDDLRSLNARLESCVAVRTAELAFANRQLCVERDRSQNLIKIAPTIILELDTQGHIVTFNPYLEELSGFCLDEVKGKNWLETFVPDRERQRISTVLEEAVTGGDTSDNINPILTKAGKERDILWLNRTLEGTEGQVTGLLSVGQDITDIRRAAEIQDVLLGILRAATEEFELRSLISKIREVVGRVIDTTNFYVALYDPEDETYRFPYFVGEEETLDPDECFALPTSLTDYVRRTGKPLWMDDEIKADLERRGEAEMVGVPTRLWLGAPLKTTQGVMGVVAVQSYDDEHHYSREALDLLVAVADTIAIAVERKRAEEALRESESLFRQVINASPNCIYVKDREGRFVLVNQRMADMHGTTPEALVGVTDLFLAEEWLTGDAEIEEFRAVELEVIDKKQMRFVPEEEFTFRDGTKRWFQTTKLPMILKNKQDYLMAVAVDITDRKLAEMELERYRAHLEDMVEEKTGQLTRAKEVTEAVNEILYEALTCEDEAGLSQLCMGVARRLTGAAFGLIGEINESGRFDTFVLDQPAQDASRIPVTQASEMLQDMEVRGIWGRVISSGQSQIINDPASHEDSVGVPEGHPELKSFLGVPLILRGQTFGMIALANKEGGFSKADQETVTVLTTAFVEVLMRLRAEQKATREARDRQRALNLMVGRELRMAKLKKEIGALENENLRLRACLGHGGESAP